MGYLSISFIVLVFASVLIYYCFPKNIRWIILLFSSILFYLSYDIRYFIFLFLSIITIYLTARFTENHNAKYLIVICIILNIIILVLVKDYNWWSFSINRVLNKANFAIRIPQIRILIPIGISYYTLQSISYLIDVYNGKISAERNFFKYSLFVIWFPAILQGPISRYKNLSEQLYNGNDYLFSNIQTGFYLIILGLIKKMIIADHLMIFVEYCFSNFEEINGLILYIGALSYSIQLYMDFSGCVDLCRGISNLYGINLIQNFEAPYFSLSIKEFWNRWHISLSSWLKDYIYIPLGGNRKGKITKYRNILITFSISGIWHGAGFGFIGWGILHAIYQIIGDMTVNIRNSIKSIIKIEKGSFSERFYQRFITFHLVTFAWIFFRANSFQGGIQYILNMISQFDPWIFFDYTVYQFGISQNLFIILVSLILLIFTVDYFIYTKNINIFIKIKDFHFVLKGIITIILILLLFIYGAYGSGYNANAFLYGGF